MPKLVRVELTSDRYRNLIPYSNSYLVAMNTCPTYGTVRFVQRKGYESNAREMALEAGSAMHEVFAMVRLWQLAVRQNQPKASLIRGKELFGVDAHRWASLSQTLIQCVENKDEDEDEQIERLTNLCFNVLHTGAFYDDPRDSMRTQSNIETAIIRYIKEQVRVMDRWNVYVSKDKKLIGIEQAVDCVLFYDDETVIRFIGTLDAIMVHPDGSLYLFENKTASRLGEAWQMSFETSHQVTGYNAMGSALVGVSMMFSRVIGIKVKQTGHLDDYLAFEPQHRTTEMIQRWGHWVYKTVKEAESYQGDNWDQAPMYTHSCNRYFRPCPLIGFCASSHDDQKQALIDMVEAPMTPSEMAIG